MADRTADQRAVIAAILVLNFVGPSTFLILPVLIEGAVHDLHFTELQVGMLSFAISAGGLVSSVLSGFWVRSLSWRTSALLSLAGMLIANTACLFWHGYMQFLLLQALAVFFGGSLGSLAMTILSDGRHAARSFGLAMAVQVTYQMIGILIGPTLLHWAGVNGVVAMLGSLSVLAAPLVALVPERGRTVASGYVTRELLRVPTLLGLAACFLFFMNVGSYWTYIDLIGRDSGISAQKVANCIAIGVSAGIVGGPARLLPRRATRPPQSHHARCDHHGRLAAFAREAKPTCIRTLLDPVQLRLETTRSRISLLCCRQSIPRVARSPLPGRSISVAQHPEQQSPRLSWRPTTIASSSGLPAQACW